MDMEKLVPIALAASSAIATVVWKVIIPGLQKLFKGFVERLDAEREKHDKLQAATIIRLERNEETHARQTREDRDLFLAALERRDAIMDTSFKEMTAAIVRRSGGRARE